MAASANAPHPAAVVVCGTADISGAGSRPGDVGGGGGAMAKEGKGKKKKRKKKKNKIYLAKCTNARMPIWSQRYKTTVISFLLAFGLITA